MDSASGRHAKGVTLVGLAKQLRARRHQAPLVGLPTTVQSLLEERILVTDWYALELLWDTLTYIDRTMLGHREAAGVEMGNQGGRQIWQAEHRALIRDISPTQAMRVMVPAWHKYFDFGSLRLETPGPEVVRFTVEGYPDMPAIHGTTTAGWHLAAAQLCGWPKARAELLDRPWKGAPALVYDIHAK